jgi:hypothetical protein
MPFLQARHPNHSASEHSILVENLIEMALSGRQEAVDAIVEMLADFHVFGVNSRFAQKLKNTPIWELKTRSRGGLKGGARVYFFVVNDELIVVNAEYKTGSDPSPQKILEVMIVLKAYLNRTFVVERSKNV